ncbi:MAG: PA2778 family cysteine peptidase [Pseudomonadota bacterium]
MRALNVLRKLIGLALVAASSACAPAVDFDEAVGVPVPTRAQVADVPLIQQAAFFCGPASIAMVMQWAGSDISQDEVADLAFSPGAGGTYLADMLGSSRRLGQLAVEIGSFDQLLSEIDADHPVIVFQNLGLGFAPVWHYGVVTGYDFVKNEIYLNSGQREQMVMPIATFQRTWDGGDNWGLAVLPPDDLPVSVDEPDILAAGAALERVGQFAAAETLYQTGAENWSNTWLWQFGLANARYAQGDLRGARAALRRARDIDGTVPEVQANLAQVERELRG